MEESKEDVELHRILIENVSKRKEKAAKISMG